MASTVLMLCVRTTSPNGRGEMRLVGLRALVIEIECPNGLNPDPWEDLKIRSPI